MMMLCIAHVFEYMYICMSVVIYWPVSGSVVQCLNAYMYVIISVMHCIKHTTETEKAHGHKASKKGKHTN